MTDQRNAKAWPRVFADGTGLFGAVWAQAEARKVLSAIGARVIDRGPYVEGRRWDLTFATAGALGFKDCTEAAPLGLDSLTHHRTGVHPPAAGPSQKTT